MRLVLLSLTACLACACAHDLETPLRSEPTVVTLVNLHADAVHGRVYSVNYLLPEVIPMCTEVHFDSIRSDEAVFRVLDSGKAYTYLFHRNLTEAPEAHLDRYFGPRCDRDRAMGLDAVDREGIVRGKVTPGMSKEGVIFAIGYPPPHQTPQLEANQWRYWKRRFDTILVLFENDRVVRVRN